MLYFYTFRKCQKTRGDVILINYDAIVIFQTFGQFGAIRKPDSRWIVCNSYIFINGNLSSYKNWKQN